MKEPKKTYVGAAVFFERLADYGWPEDAGCWPIAGVSPLGASKSASSEAEGFLSQFIKSLLRATAIEPNCHRLRVT